MTLLFHSYAYTWNSLQQSHLYPCVYVHGCFILYSSELIIKAQL